MRDYNRRRREEEQEDTTSSCSRYLLGPVRVMGTVQSCDPSCPLRIMKLSGCRKPSSVLVLTNTDVSELNVNEQPLRLTVCPRV